MNREQFTAFVRDLRLDVKTVECRLYSRSMCVLCVSPSRRCVGLVALFLLLRLCHFSCCGHHADRHPSLYVDAMCLVTYMLLVRVPLLPRYVPQPKS